MFSRIAFLHLLRVPCGTGQPCLIQGCDNLRLFQVSEEETIDLDELEDMFPDDFCGV